MSEAQIVEVFGKFVVELGKGPEMFDSQAEAAAAQAEFLNGAEHRALAADYCAYMGLEGKNAKGKTNVVTSFLAWVDASRPERQTVEEVEAGEAEEAAELVDGAEVQF